MGIKKTGVNEWLERETFVLTRSRATSSRWAAFSHCRMMEGHLVNERFLIFPPLLVGSFLEGDGRSYVLVVTEGLRLGIMP